MGDADTIAAISSPLGQGGIGIVRMSGPKAHSVLKEIFTPRHAVESYASHHLYLGFLHDPHRNTDVDEVFAVFMDEPHTYTKERMAEVYCHGGLAAQRQALIAMISAGARIAEPGEFTKRAFLNGRIDLAQAESVLDIIESESLRELESAVDHIKGRLSERIDEIKKDLLGLLAEVEADMDFPEEQLSVHASSWPKRMEELREAASQLIDSYDQGRVITRGLSILILGKSNVGKSSLLNAITQSDRAIVTSVPGTTRDVIDDTIYLNGTKMRITDTAGLRLSDDPIEKEGIERARRLIPDADLVLWVLDGSTGYTEEDEAIYRQIAAKRAITVVNKADLPRQLENLPAEVSTAALVTVSALTGAGIDALKKTIYETCLSTETKASSLLITNVRHRDTLQKMEGSLRRARESCLIETPLEFIAFELRESMSYLGEITGETCPDEVLEQIFNRFCIGK